MAPIGNTRPLAMSSVYGKIDDILLSFPGDQDQIESRMVVRRYKEFFEAFGDRVSFVLMGNFGEKKDEIREELAAKDFYPHLVDTPMASSKMSKDAQRKQGEFIQDPFVMMASAHGEPLLLEQYRDVQHKNAFLADQYADEMGIPILPTRFALEGGNILVGDDYALVGRNLLARNAKLYYGHLDAPEQEKRLRERLKSLLGMRYVYFIGEDRELEFAKKWYPDYPEGLQPFFHLDLYLTLGGKNKAGDEIVLLAEIDTKAVAAGDALSEKQNEILNEINAALKAVKDQLTQISENSFGPRFKIEEIPMGGRFVMEDGVQRFLPYSYNNAQVEWYHGISRIYLPSYAGCEALENRLRENLPGLGFGRLTFVEYEFKDYAEQNGSLHCLTKVLRRTAY